MCYQRSAKSDNTKHERAWETIAFLFFQYLFGCLGSQLQHAGSFIFIAGCGSFSCSLQTLSCGIWDLLPDQRSNLGPLLWEPRVVATGPPGKSPLLYFLQITHRHKNWCNYIETQLALIFYSWTFVYSVTQKSHS